MARKSNKAAVIEYITLRRITVNSTGQVFEKLSPFPSGLPSVDYANLLQNRLITTLDDFQKIDTGRCLTCGE